MIELHDECIRIDDTFAILGTVEGTANLTGTNPQETADSYRARRIPLVWTTIAPPIPPGRSGHLERQSQLIDAIKLRNGRWSNSVQQSKFVGRDRRTTTYGTIVQPARCTVDAIIRAAALMACADGKPATQERITLAAVLRNHGLLELHGEQALLSTYDEAISQRHVNGEWDAAFEHLATLAGNHGAVIAGMTAAHVAVADGVLWPTEVALLRILRERLGISTRPKR